MQRTEFAVSWNLWQLPQLGMNKIVHFSNSRALPARLTGFLRGIIDGILSHFQLLQSILSDFRSDFGRQLLRQCENDFLFIFLVRDGMDWTCRVNIAHRLDSDGVSSSRFECRSDLRLQFSLKLFVCAFCRPLVMSSLILIAIGNGSIRACITALGGHQFQMPEQSKQLDQYFSNSIPWHSLVVK